MPRPEFEAFEVEDVVEALPAAAGCTRCIPPDVDAAAGIVKSTLRQQSQRPKRGAHPLYPNPDGFIPW